MGKRYWNRAKLGLGGCYDVTDADITNAAQKLCQQAVLVLVQGGLGFHLVILSHSA